MGFALVVHRDAKWCAAVLLQARSAWESDGESKDGADLDAHPNAPWVRARFDRGINSCNPTSARHQPQFVVAESRSEQSHSFVYQTQCNSRSLVRHRG